MYATVIPLAFDSVKIDKVQNNTDAFDDTLHNICAIDCRIHAKMYHYTEINRKKCMNGNKMIYYHQK